MSFSSLFPKKSSRNLKQEHLDMMTCYSEKQREMTFDDQTNKKRLSYRLFSRGGRREQEPYRDHKAPICLFASIRRRVSSTQSYEEMKSIIFEEAEEWMDCPPVHISQSMLDGISTRDNSTESGFDPAFSLSNTSQRASDTPLRTPTFLVTESCHPAISYTLHPPPTPKLDAAWKVVDTSSFSHGKPSSGDRSSQQTPNIEPADAVVVNRAVDARRINIQGDYRPGPATSASDPRPIMISHNIRPNKFDGASRIETLSKQIEDLHLTIAACEETLNSLITARANVPLIQRLEQSARSESGESTAETPDESLDALCEVRALSSPAQSAKFSNSPSSGSSRSASNLSATLLGALELSQACVISGYSGLYSNAPEPVTKRISNYPQADCLTPPLTPDSTSSKSTLGFSGQQSKQLLSSKPMQPSWEPDRSHLAAVCGDMWSVKPVVRHNSVESDKSSKPPPIPAKSTKRRRTRPVLLKLIIPS